MKVYIASSFKNIHGVRLLAKSMRDMGYSILDWTEKATPPEGLNVAERREWMDTDHGGEVFSFCAQACKDADFLIYLGTSGQDAGVEIGMAYGNNLPILAIRGPLEAPGLMLHGAVHVWVEHIEDAATILKEIIEYQQNNTKLNVKDFRVGIIQSCEHYKPVDINSLQNQSDQTQDYSIISRLTTNFIPMFSGQLCAIDACTVQCVKKKLRKDLPKYSEQAYKILSRIKKYISHDSNL